MANKSLLYYCGTFQPSAPTSFTYVHIYEDTRMPPMPTSRYCRRSGITSYDGSTIYEYIPCDSVHRYLVVRTVEQITEKLASLLYLLPQILHFEHSVLAYYKQDHKFSKIDMRSIFPLGVCSGILCENYMKEFRRFKISCPRISNIFRKLRNPQNIFQTLLMRA